MQHEVKVQLRLPVEIRDALALDARNNDRSMNSQVIAILRQHFRAIGIGTETQRPGPVTGNRS